MGECLFTPVSSGLRIECLDTDTPSLPPEQQQQVDQVWADSGLTRNDWILGFVGLHDQVVLAKPIEYKAYYVGLKHPELFQGVGAPIALAVSGFLCNGDQWLVGQRAETVTQYPGALEFVPSGSIDDKSSSIEQVQQELLEEAGMIADRVEPFGVVYDIEGRVTDICLRLEVEVKVEPKAGNEYSGFHWWNLDQIRASIKRDVWVPTSQVVVAFAIKN